jgi:hypothetical protein
MQESELMRGLLAIVAVEPLLDFFSLLKAANAGPEEPQARVRDCQDHLEGFARRWQELGFGVEEARMICDVVEQLGARLAAQEGAPVRSAAPPEAPTDFTPAGLLDFLEQSVLTATTTTLHIRWTLLEPLALYWRGMLRLYQVEASAPSAGQTLAEGIPEWLGRVPIPVEFARMPQTTARADLRSLSETLFRLPVARLLLGGRLRERFGREVDYDLDALLGDLGYLPGSSARVGSDERGGLL